MFLDESRISVKGGAGGNGCSAFRREKFEPFGGPNGGDGGRGGHVILEASAHLHTLFDVGSFRTYRGERGQHGMGSNCTGRDGEDAIVRVPVGTLVKSEIGEVLADLSEPGQTFIAAKGGRGGAGNQHFATARHQKPTRAYPGFPGEERVLHLELKLVADVGLVGFPNAGKSSLLTALSKATPKIADYPFTTLEPALGIVPVGNYASIVMADIPGLIEGASQGKGLGHRFLRHIERTRTLLFVLDPWSQGGETPEERLEHTRTMLDVLRGELGAYHARLLEKPWRIALNKSDLGEPFPAQWMPEALPISAAAHLGLPELVDALWKTVENETDRNRITIAHEYLDLPEDVPDWYKPGENG